MAKAVTVGVGTKVRANASDEDRRVSDKLYYSDSWGLGDSPSFSVLDIA